MKTHIVPIVCAAGIAIANVSAAVASPHSDSAAVPTDAVLGRPVGLVATVIGSAIFVASLPIAVISGSVGSSAEALVLRPARDTFVRPLGDLDYHKNPSDRNMAGKHRRIRKARS